ncbi:putative bifunctional diguanylate cyclase/phosphodiesterase [Ilumatobacter sp.]|uniref:putative bifunctional diguanylate cyclase/phosphodiesterase n=1 Tax=Ilumatobacter sp. TaxID=1967498 RepID=UPI003B52411F
MTSERLATDQVANRMFPKVRSWIALGAPLELLSPLSIARVVAIAASATWLLGALAGVVPTVIGLVLAASAAGAVGSLASMRALAQRQGTAMAAATLVAIAIAVAASSSTDRVLLHAPLLAILSVYVGLFSRPRALLLSQLVGCAVMLATLGWTSHGTGTGDGASVLVFAVVLSSMTALSARTSRMAGLLDADTGLSNARGIERRIVSRESGVDQVIATIHLSGVNEVRDALGHNAGSELVRRAVEDLGQVLPASTGIGRSGDDIVVVVDVEPPACGALGRDGDATSGTGPLREAIESVVARTVRHIETAIGSGRYMVGQIEVALIAHVGVTTTDPRAEHGAGELLRQSALAAREARDQGRSCARWSGEETAFSAADLEILADLRTASDRGELWIAYQPQVRAPDGRIVAAEALLRWSSPTHGAVPPGRFIPLAERTGLVDRLTEWVLGEALDAQVRWRRLGHDITVSVNVSPLSLRSLEFAERVIDEIDVRDLPSDVLMLEVTESVAFDVPEAVERLAPLRARGVKVSIDDFGTGCTSLAILPQLPLDELKVDQEFVCGATTSSASEAIVRSVCELGHRLGLTVVAEGVEDSELADLMTVFGYDLLQGYHFARPMPEDQLIARLAAQDDFSTAHDPRVQTPIVLDSTGRPVPTAPRAR